jgi:ribose transport system substrate-binding protein
MMAADMGKAMKTRDQYVNKSVLSAARLLKAFQAQGEKLRLTEIVERSGFTKAKAYRLLYTLEQCGFIEKSGDKRYRSTIQMRPARRFTIGFAWPGEDYLFSRDVNESVRRAAERAHLNVILADNRYNSKVAVRNADMLIREGVDLAMEFQTDERAAPIIAAKYRDAGIPLIAIEIPHPGAIFYGANNYEAGLIGGRHISRWVKRHWAEPVEEIIMLGLPRAGSLPAARITGMLAGMREILRYLEGTNIVHLDGDGTFGGSADAVRKHLRHGFAERTLVGAINDLSALGALHAFKEMGRLNHCAVVGQNASPEARFEMRRAGSRLIGSVGYFPERYGDDLIPLALAILNKEHVCPAVFIKHKMIDASNVDHFYPNDGLRRAG